MADSKVDMNPLANHDVNQLPIRAYLESNLMPLLLEALNELAKHKPQDPIEFIANYMLEHNPENR